MAAVKKEELPSEHEEQVALVVWWGEHAAEFGLTPQHLFAIPNGASYGGDMISRARTSKRMKAEGQRNGVPDLFLAAPRDGKHGLFIEMKRQKRGVLSEDQEDYMELLDARGYSVVVAKGCMDAVKKIFDYFGRSWCA